MKLNPDCIRDILLYCENKCTPDDEAEFDYHNPFVYNGNEYSGEITIYHLRQCALNEFFVDTEDYASAKTYCVTDITPKAHEFLANIRKDTIWQRTKAIATKVGSPSLNSLYQIASSVVSEIIKSQFIN